MENIGYYNNDSEKRSSFEMANSANTNNLRIEEPIIEHEVTTEQEIKQTPLNESETSLEFASCCSTPMSSNDSKSLANKENFSIEKVIASLNFKTNNVLLGGLDMEQFNASNEENEVTCIEAFNNLSSKDRDEDESQNSVLEAKTPIEAYNFDYQNDQNQKETESVITTVTSDSFQWYHKPDFPSLNLDEAKTPVEFNTEDQFENNTQSVLNHIENYLGVETEVEKEEQEVKTPVEQSVDSMEINQIQKNAAMNIPETEQNQFENNIQSVSNHVQNCKELEVVAEAEKEVKTPVEQSVDKRENNVNASFDIPVDFDTKINQDQFENNTQSVSNNIENYTVEEVKLSSETLSVDSNETVQVNQVQTTITTNEIKTSVDLLASNEPYQWSQAQIDTVNGEEAKTPVNVSEIDSYEWYQKQVTTEVTTEVIEINQVDFVTVDLKASNETNVQTQVIHPTIVENNASHSDELEPVQKENDQVIIIDHRLKESDENKEMPQKEITSYINNIILDVLTETDQRTNLVQSENKFDDQYSSFNTLDEVTNNFVVINTPDLKEIISEIKLEEELKTNDLSMSNIEEAAATATEENDENVDTSVLNENENEIKPADTTAKSSKQKQDNKKSKEPPVDCFGCLIL